MRGIASTLLCALLFFEGRARAACPNLCSGHGRCVEVSRCECFANWQGGDCSQRKCPFGIAWVDIASGDDVAHQPAECSNRGVCNTKTGECECMDGYEGIACSRMTCPAECGRHGECHSMKQHAAAVDRGLLKVPQSYTNVRPPYTYKNAWDADLIHGCTCDSGYESWDCSTRKCPRGDDPMTTGQSDEVQVLRCDVDPSDPTFAGNQFTLSFRGAVTKPFAPDVDTATLAGLLEQLPTIGDVGVSYSAGVTLCDASYAGSGNPAVPASGNVVSITFRSEHGDVPRLVWLDQNAKPLYGAKDNLVWLAADGETLTYTTSLSPVATTTVASVSGDKEDLPCSGRGRCNVNTGVCSCFTGYTGSDGRGNAGTVADCGAAYIPITSCPGAGVECSGHGVCSGHPSYKCTCYEGWANGDCSERTCPLGKAWFDYPTANDEAHALVECSNKGKCNRISGQCECQSMFEGEACERMMCPGKLSPAGVCSGHGRCLPMSDLAAYATTNGDPTPFTYGADPNSPATWDAESVYGCLCDEGYTGYDCGGRTCPWGNDITLLEYHQDRLDEAQVLTCVVLDDGTTVPPAPTLRLSFRGAETVDLPYNAAAADVKAALEAISTIEGIDVTYTSAQTSGPDELCLPGPGGQTITFLFRTEHGDVPPIQVVMDESTRDPVTGAYSAGVGWDELHLEFTGGTHASGYTVSGTYTKGPSGFPSTGIRTQEIQKGLSGNAECSGRGLCDRATGQCKCFIGFGASNDDRAAGPIENCGWREPYQWPLLRGSKA